MLSSENLGVQLWSIREPLKRDPIQTLKRLKHDGFELVESVDLQQLASLSPILKTLDMRAKSSFWQWTFLTERWDLIEANSYLDRSIESQFELAAKFELEYVVNGYLLPQERQTFDAFQRITDKLQMTAETAKKWGIKMAYHNHGFEFELRDKNGDTALEYVIKNTDDVMFELDTMWAYVAGQNVTELIDLMAQKLKLLHLKDTRFSRVPLFDDQVKPQQDFVAQGKGRVPFSDIIKRAEHVDYYFLEQDYSTDIFDDLTTGNRHILNLC